MTNDEISQDTRSSLNPYRIGHEIYRLVEGYFVNKYEGLQVSESFPREPSAGPTITWRILRRVPGGGRDGIAQAKGPSYTNTTGVDEFGQVSETHTQQFRMTLEFSLVSTSRAKLEELAWDWENAMLDVVGPLQQMIPGFSMAFSEQPADSQVGYRIQDELLAVHLRYEILMPVRYRVLLPQLRQAVVEQVFTGFTDSTGRVVREGTDPDYDVPVPDGARATDILAVYRRLETASPLLLQAGIDYQVVKLDDGSARLRWLDDNGSTPAEGEQFLVQYAYSPTVRSHSVSGIEQGLPPTVRE